MSERGRELIIRRILVALDASPHSRAALEAAAQLAARFHAELLGVFVEDINLLRLAEMPFMREFGFFSASSRQLGTAEMERQLRAQARQMREAMTRVAEREQLQWSFRVVRGTIRSELIAAASEADLFILGKAGQSLVRRRRLGSTAQAVVFRGPGLTLLLQANTCLGVPVMVIYDGSIMARRALATAASLVPQEGERKRELYVITADGAQETAQYRREAAEWLRAQGVEARFRALTQTNVPRLLDLVREEKCGVLVLPSQTTLLEDEALLALLNEIQVPVLLVR